MKISVVTVCYNARHTIADAMGSVAVQRGGGAEVEYIVVDGGSVDGTVDVIRRFAESQPGRPGFSFRWISEKDRGMYDAINKGVGMATGEVVGILNADDVLDGADVLAGVAREWARLGRGGGLDCLYGNVRFVSDGRVAAGAADGADVAAGMRRLRALPTRRVCFARLWQPWMLQWGYMPPHPAIFIRRDCFGKWGGYEPDRREYRIAADYELLIRYFRVNRMRAKYMPVCTTVMRTGGVSTRDVEARRKLNEEIVKANRVNGYFCCFPMLLPKYFVKVWEVILPRIGLLGAGAGHSSETESEHD